MRLLSHQMVASASLLGSGTERLMQKRVRISVLVFMTLQNSVHTLLLRYSRSRDVTHMFLPSVAVSCTEVVKLVVCVGVISVQLRSFRRCCSLLRATVFGNLVDTLKVAVPSLIYTIQNNLFYLAATHLDGATFMVTSQLKILTTAVFAVVMLRKPLAFFQWCALLLLFVGVSMVQLQTSSGGGTAKDERKQNPLLGFLAVLAASILSGFAGVYFEKILKGSSGSASVSLWERNVQLAMCAVPLSVATAAVTDGAVIADVGAWRGFDAVVWLTVGCYAIGGLTVAVCVKYADNIAKNFATSVAILISTAVSAYWFHFRPSALFAVGASLVIASIFAFSMPSTTTAVKTSNGSLRTEV